MRFVTALFVATSVFLCSESVVLSTFEKKEDGTFLHRWTQPLDAAATPVEEQEAENFVTAFACDESHPGSTTATSGSDGENVEVDTSSVDSLSSIESDVEDGDGETAAPCPLPSSDERGRERKLSEEMEGAINELLDELNSEDDPRNRTLLTRILSLLAWHVEKFSNTFPDFVTKKWLAQNLSIGMKFKLKSNVLACMGEADMQILKDINRNLGLVESPRWWGFWETQVLSMLPRGYREVLTKPEKDAAAFRDEVAPGLADTGLFKPPKAAVIKDAGSGEVDKMPDYMKKQADHLEDFLWNGLTFLEWKKNQALEKSGAASGQDVGRYNILGYAPARNMAELKKSIGAQMLGGVVQAVKGALRGRKIPSDK